MKVKMKQTVCQPTMNYNEEKIYVTDGSKFTEKEAKHFIEMGAAEEMKGDKVIPAPQRGIKTENTAGGQGAENTGGPGPDDDPNFNNDDDTEDSTDDEATKKAKLEKKAKKNKK
jgi:hypothetical protein